MPLPPPNSAFDLEAFVIRWGDGDGGPINAVFRRTRTLRFAVMVEYAKTGAHDSEPRYVLRSLLSEVFGAAAYERFIIATNERIRRESAGKYESHQIWERKARALHARKAETAGDVHKQKGNDQHMTTGEGHAMRVALAGAIRQWGASLTIRSPHKIERVATEQRTSRLRLNRRSVVFRRTCAVSPLCTSPSRVR